MRRNIVKGLTQLWKEYDYHSIYTVLSEKNYSYTLGNIERDFNKIDSSNKFCYLIYLLSRDYCIKNVLLVCDFLIYTDTFFYDIHPVIRMMILHAIEFFPTDNTLLEWIISTYDNHPDSPFTKEEIAEYKGRIGF